MRKPYSSAVALEWAQEGANEIAPTIVAINHERAPPIKPAQSLDLVMWCDADRWKSIASVVAFDAIGARFAQGYLAARGTITRFEVPRLVSEMATISTRAEFGC